MSPLNMQLTAQSSEKELLGESKGQQRQIATRNECALGSWCRRRRQALCLKSPKKILAIKFWRFSVLGMGSGVSPVSSSVVVRPSVSPKPERSESPKKAKSRKKMKRPTTAGAACRRAQRPATPEPTPKAHAANCQIKESRKMVSSLARR